TQPTRRAGRGGKLRPTPIAEIAAQESLNVNATENINSNETLADIQQIGADVICVADFGQLIGEPVRSAAAMGAFNLHGSLLPELRGAAPINWAIIRGYERTGVTTFSLVDRMDAGPIYAMEETDISPHETAQELRTRLAQLGAKLVCRTLDLLASGKAQGQEQDESKATLAPRLKKTDGLIDFSVPAEQIRNLIHGTWTWPGGQAVFRRSDGKTVNVTIARVAVEPTAAHCEPGVLDTELCIATPGGRLRIEQIKPAGKKLMAWDDFVNGYRPSEGDRFEQCK
ncbi:MAG: methionyl-tRNA formyltransferase, partial [Planctomycetota bacterium]